MSYISFNHEISISDIVSEMDDWDAKEMRKALDENFGRSGNLVDTLESCADELIENRFGVQSCTDKTKFIELKEMLNQIL